MRAVGRPSELHVQQHEGQPVRRSPTSTLARTRRRRTTTTWTPSTRTSIYDSPHRIILAPIVNLPAPEDKSGIAYALLGGWNASAVVELVSGAPLNAVLSQGASDADLGLFGGRQRPNLVGDPNTTGSDDGSRRVGGSPDARGGSTPAAYANPGAGQFGNAPRTNPDARFQFRKNIDLVLAKSTAFGAWTERGDPVRDSQPHEHREVRQRVDQQRDRLDELRPR